MNSRHEKIRHVLSQHPEGIHFNALYRQVKDVCAVQTLWNILKEWVKDGLVTREPENPRKGQKVFFKSTTASKTLDDDSKRLQDLYEFYHKELILCKYLAERGHKFKLSFIPGMMEELFGQGAVNNVLLPGLEDARKYQGQVRSRLLKNTVEVFLAIQDEYVQFLTKHPELAKEVLQYIETSMRKAVKEFDNIKNRSEGSPLLHATLSREEKEVMVEDFSEWIEGKAIENGNNLREYFKSMLMAKYGAE